MASETTVEYRREDGWWMTTWKGDGFPGGHLTSYSRRVWSSACQRRMPREKPWYGRPCGRQQEVIETVDLFMDGTSDHWWLRPGCSYCSSTAKHDGDDDWHVIADDEPTGGTDAN